MSDSGIPWTVAYQAPQTMESSRQEYWSGLPFPSPGDLPDPGIEPRSPMLQADALPSEPPGKPILYTQVYIPVQSLSFEIWARPVIRLWYVQKGRECTDIMSMTNFELIQRKIILRSPELIR